mmetsp:Transcript_30000/g.75664  ORF Transcript_30000/g.75664 Transcript_30000/m.75664 type:complete len:768 (+) Transcript_30000:145-2448(+)
MAWCSTSCVPSDADRVADEWSIRSQHLLQPAVPGLSSRRSVDSAQFTWNHRPCVGTLFHKAVLDGDISTALAWMQEDPQVLTSRFHYETFHDGVAQEGSGEAIHLAASRGHQAVVELLIGAGAQLEAPVTRGCQDHYNVLSAAVFAEGKGGSSGMVEYLLEAKAQMMPNLDRKWPLHFAYQTGAVHLLTMLREAAKDQGVAEQILHENPSPLLFGIQSRCMSEKQLARSVVPTPTSLRTFLDHDPGCIPHLMARLRRDAETAAKLAKHICGEDIARVVRTHPAAAAALLDGLTSRPVCENPGLHPLPVRVSFAPRCLIERLHGMFNPGRTAFSIYTPETVWEYDGVSFEAPAWHKHIDSRSWGRPFMDAQVEVCHVPNLVCPDFFAALVDASQGFAATEQSLDIFNEPVVRAAIQHGWWHGACRLDILHVAFTFWGLLWLIYDSCLLSSTTLSVDFIGALGIVDAFFGLLHLVGWWLSGGTANRLLNREALWSAIRTVVPMMLPFAQQGNVLMVIVVLIYWCQFLGFFTWSENIARSLLPLTRLAHSLVPAGVVTLVLFFAFTHAALVLNTDTGSAWYDTLSSSFAVLFTEKVPKLSEESSVQHAFYCVAICVFSVFMLNIFIGVVGEEYEKQRRMSKCVYRLVRAQKIQSFLTTARVLPCALTSKRMASRVATVACLTALAVQLVGLQQGRPWPWTRLILVMCQATMILATYQNPTEHWAVRRDACCRGLHLWMVRVADHSVEGGDEDDEEDDGTVVPRDYEAAAW